MEMPRSINRYLLCAIVLQFLVQGDATVYRMKLFDAVRLKPTTVDKFPDVNAVHGLDSKQPAFSFGKKTADVKINTKSYKTFQDEFNSNNDVTFAFTLNLKAIAAGRTATLVSIMAPVTVRKHFVLSLQITKNFAMGLEGERNRSVAEYGHEAILELTYDSHGREVRSRMALGTNVTIGKWLPLMFRLKNRKHVTVYLNCKPIVERTLALRVTNMPNDGELRITQSCASDFWTGGLRIDARLLGKLARAEILFGSLAYQVFSTCTKVQPVMNVEGSKTQDKSDLFEKYLAMSGSLVSEYQDSTCLFGGQKYRNGESWAPEKCRNCSCKDGKVSCENACKSCTYKFGVYRHGRVFNPPGQSCQSCTCEDGVVKCATIVCPKLTCRFGTDDSKGCCPICKETKCALQGKIFGLGCKRKCVDLDYYGPCPKRRMGCYCPRGTVENDSGQCVRTSDCTCKVKQGGKIKEFKANKVIALSSCRYCACSHGKMQCLIYC